MLRTKQHKTSTDCWRLCFLFWRSRRLLVGSSAILRAASTILSSTSNSLWSIAIGSSEVSNDNLLGGRWALGLSRLGVVLVRGSDRSAAHQHILWCMATFCVLITFHCDSYQRWLRPPNAWQFSLMTSRGFLFLIIQCIYLTRCTVYSPTVLILHAT